MVLPFRPSTCGPVERFPQIASSLPKVSTQQPIRTAVPSPVTRLPPIGPRTNYNPNARFRETSCGFAPLSHNSASATQFVPPKTRSNRCTTAGQSLITRKVQPLQLDPSAKNLKTPKPSANNSKTDIKNNVDPGITSNDINWATANYSELKEANFSRSPYLPSRSVMDSKMKSLQDLRNSINRLTFSRLSDIGPVGSTGNGQGNSGQNSSLRRTSDLLQQRSATSGLNLKSIPIERKGSKSRSKEEGLLSAFTVMDPGSQREVDILAIAKRTETLNRLLDENNNVTLGTKSPSRKGSQNRVDLDVDTPTSKEKKSKRKKRSRRAREKSEKAEGSKSASDTRSGTSVVGPPDSSVRSISSEIYRKLQDLGFEDALRLSNSIGDRKETINKLKKAYAVLQKQLEDLNIEEEVMAAKGLDYRDFERGQREELEALRTSAQPFMTSFKGMRPSDFRTEGAQLPLLHLHDMLQAPEIDPSLFPKRTKVRMPPVNPLDNLENFEPTVKKIVSEPKAKRPTKKVSTLTPQRPASRPLKSNIPNPSITNVEEKDGLVKSGDSNNNQICVQAVTVPKSKQITQRSKSK